jgi:hypothetical protein
MPEKTLTTLQKALEINLDPCKYGTIAEIGAGQEVARFFFQAGGAAGTVAKTMSAYDMQFSDAIYGEESNGRYVSRSRVERMLEKEYSLVITRTRESRPKNSTFFAFADTVAAKGFKSERECHGWMGVRVQLYPDAPPSEVLLHVRMLDQSNPEQQHALGILGVNLIYGAYNHYRDPERLIESLVDDVGTDRVEIDMIHFNGPYFEDIDNRLMALHLVKSGLTHGVMFGPEGDVLQPSDVLYKKNALVARGSFRPVTKVNMDMFRCGIAQFMGEDDTLEEKTVVLAEITTANLMGEGEIDPKDFLARVDILGALGLTVLISNYLRYFRLRAYINRYTKRKIAIVLGIKNIVDIFNEDFYEGLEGGILEAFGKLFAGNTRLHVYPCLNETGDLMTVDQLHVNDHVQHLLRHLIHTQDIVPLEGADASLMTIDSRKVLAEIKSGDGAWCDALPESACQTITEKRLFGYDSE